jgi:hypothetical protein
VEGERVLCAGTPRGDDHVPFGFAVGEGVASEQVAVDLVADLAREVEERCPWGCPGVSEGWCRHRGTSIVRG